MLPRTTAVINSKGGVGKTSIATNLAALVAAAGYRALLVDLDPQGNASRDLGVTGTPNDDHGAAMFAAAATGQPLRPVADVRPSLDLVCGGPQIGDMVGALYARQARGTDTAHAVNTALAPTAGGYDLIVLDCPPGEQQIQRMALNAAQYVLIPTKPDAASMDGLAGVATLFSDIAASTNPDLELLGVVLFDVEVSAKRIRRDARETVGRDLGDPDLVFEPYIRHALSAAVGGRDRGLVVHEMEESLPEERRAYFEALRDRSKGRHRDDRPRPVTSVSGLAGDYAALAAEVLDRINARQQVTL